jgi:hypothetical protein
LAARSCRRRPEKCRAAAGDAGVPRQVRDRQRDHPRSRRRDHAEQDSRGLSLPSTRLLNEVEVAEEARHAHVRVRRAGRNVLSRSLVVAIERVYVVRVACRSRRPASWHCRARRPPARPASGTIAARPPDRRGALAHLHDSGDRLPLLSLDLSAGGSFAYERGSCSAAIRAPSPSFATTRKRSRRSTTRSTSASS